MELRDGAMLKIGCTSCARVAINWKRRAIAPHWPPQFARGEWCMRHSVRVVVRNGRWLPVLNWKCYIVFLSL